MIFNSYVSLQEGSEDGTKKNINFTEHMGIV